MEKRERKKRTGVARKGLIKNIVIIILAVALAGESFALIMGKVAPKINTDIEPPVVTLDVGALGTDIIGKVTGLVGDILPEIKVGGDIDFSGVEKELLPMVEKILYSNLTVDLIMSMSYPLLYNTLVDLGLLKFAQAVDLYPTGPEAATLFENKGFTCTDKDGTRKDLAEVLKAIGDGWDYMNTKVTMTTADGEQISTTIWNTIDWHVTDKVSFFSAMDIMSEALRGVLEVDLQNKRKVANVNAIEAVTGIDAINFRLDAAELFNSNDVSGYAAFVIPLFEILGLKPGEFVAEKDFCEYTKLSDMWEAIFGAVFTGVNKLLEDPVNNLMTLLMNFVNALETGTIANGMRKMQLDADYNPLASLAMGFEDGELANLGQILLDLMDSMGLDLTGDINNLLSKLVGGILGDKFKIPTIDAKKLLSYGEKSKTASGNDYYTAKDGKEVMMYLVDSVMPQVLDRI